MENLSKLAERLRVEVILGKLALAFGALVSAYFWGHWLSVGEYQMAWAVLSIGLLAAGAYYLMKWR